MRVTRGAIWDVIVDLRPESPTFQQHFGDGALGGEPATQLYIPKGMAHGFQTLEDETEVFYQISEFYAPESARGYRWDDPAVRDPLARAGDGDLGEGPERCRCSEEA